jgi:hypothetical protein
MTRSAWVTVRLPGARTAPPTSTRIWLQSGAVKHGRKTASQDIRTVGTVGWAVADSMRLCVIKSVESSRPRRARVSRHGQTTPQRPRHQTLARLMFTAMDDPIVSSASAAPGGPCSRSAATVVTRFTVPSPARWSHACVRPVIITDLKYSIARSGRIDGPRQARSDAPSWRSMTRYASSPARISSGL